MLLMALNMPTLPCYHPLCSIWAEHQTKSLGKELTCPLCRTEWGEFKWKPPPPKRKKLVPPQGSASAHLGTRCGYCKKVGAASLWPLLVQLHGGPEYAKKLFWGSGYSIFQRTAPSCPWSSATVPTPTPAGAHHRPALSVPYLRRL